MIFGVGFVLAGRVAGNWLHQCSPCVDQSLLSDITLKSDIRPANLSTLYSQVRQLPLRLYQHVDPEFVNRFIARDQLGLVAAELAQIVPEAVALLPERRYTHMNGSSLSQRNVQMVRDTHILFSVLGAVQELIKRFELLDSDYWEKIESYYAELVRAKSKLNATEEQLFQIDRITQDHTGRIVVLSADLSSVKADLRTNAGAITELEAKISVLKEVNAHLKDEVQRASAAMLEQSVLGRANMANLNTTVHDRVTAVSSRLENLLSDLTEALETVKGDAQAQDATLAARITAVDGRVSGVAGNLWTATTKLHYLEASQSALQQTVESFMNKMARISGKIFHKLAQFNDTYEVDKRQKAQRLLETQTKLEEAKQQAETAALSTQRGLLTNRDDLERARDADNRDKYEKFHIQLQGETQRFQTKQRELQEAAEMERLQLTLEVEREKLKVDLASRIEEARIKEEHKLKDRRLNEDVNLRELQAKSQEEREHTLQAIREVAGIVENWLTTLFSSRENLGLVIGSVVALAAGIFLARETAILFREQLNKHLGKPSLVRYTSRKSTLYEITDYVKNTRIVGFVAKKLGISIDNREALFKDVVLHPALFAQVKRLATATQTAKTRKQPLMHCMFYGPPGTGKTLTAKKFAEYSGLEYAIMCGGDVAPLGENAVTELHNLFKWINTSRRGVVLFIDEAESFLCARHAGMSENLRNALTAMLYHTGTASSQFMLILATNRPGDLDAAVLDRVDEAIEFGLPDLNERKRMVSLYFNRFGGKVGEKAGVSQQSLENAAAKIAGFSGREISKLFLALQTHAFAAGHHDISEDMLIHVVEQKVKEHERNKQIQAHGYNYDHVAASNSQPSSQSNSVFCVVDAPERVEAPTLVTVNKSKRK